jgi:hypothetical protein
VEIQTYPGFLYQPSSFNTSNSVQAFSNLSLGGSGLSGGYINQFSAPFSTPVQQFGQNNLQTDPMAGQFFHSVFQLINSLTQMLSANTGIGQQNGNGFNPFFGGDPFTDFQTSFTLPQLKVTACPAASFENPFSVPELGTGGNATSNAYFQLCGNQALALR